MLKQTGRPELLKYMNQELVIRHIVKNSEVSRADLARQTGLALPSIMRIVEALIEKGFVVETGRGDSSGGRKPQLLTLNKDYMWILGIEIASRSILTLTDFAGHKIESSVIDTWFNDCPEDTLQKLLEASNALIEKHHIPKNQLTIGIGTPGHGFKHHGPKKGYISKGWESIDVKAWFEERIGVLVITENVCRTRTLSEIWFGVGREQSNFLYAFIDQGVGIGLVSEGQLVLGHNGVSGEFGHVSIDCHGKPCYCGKSGCIEMYVSLGAFEEEKPFDWTCTHFNDDSIRAFIKSRAEILAFALSNVVNLLNPPMIVMGGIVSRHLPTFVTHVSEQIEPYIFHHLATGVKIVRSEVDNESICLGSVALVINHVLTTRI